MKYLHSMIRVTNLEDSINFFTSNLGMTETRRIESETGRFTLVFLAAFEDLGNAKLNDSPVLELTWNWDPEEYDGGRNFGHLAYSVDDIYLTCQKLLDNGVTINRPPRDGKMAFIRSPDGISIELLQKGESLPKQEPWSSMDNIGVW